MKIVSLNFGVFLTLGTLLWGCGRAVNCKLAKERLTACYSLGGVSISTALQTQIDDSEKLCDAYANLTVRSENFYRWHDCNTALGQSSASGATGPDCSATNLASSDVLLNPILSCNSFLSVATFAQ